MQRVLIIIAAVTLVLLVSVAIVLATLDVNKYTPRIVAAVEQPTGREFAIAGDIGLKPALIPTLSVRGVTFGNADWAAHETMVSIERFEAQIRLLPILSGQIDIKRFVLIGVRVVLETDRKGRGNWLLDLEGASEEAATPSQAPIFDLQEVVIRDAVIEYRAFDADAVTLAIEELGFETERLGQPLQLDLDAQFNEQRFTVRGTVAPLRRLARNEPFDIDLTLSVREIDFSVQGEIARPLDASGIDLTFAIALPSTLALADFISGELPDFAPVILSGKLSGGGKRYLVDDLNAVIGPSDVAGRVTVDLDDDRPLIEANFESKLIDLSALPPAADSTTAHNTRVFSTDPLPLDALGQLDAKISLLVGRLQTAEVTLETLRAVAELERSKLSVDEFTATIAGGRVEAEVLLDARREVPRFAKTAHIDDMALAPFLGGSDVASGGIADLDV